MKGLRILFVGVIVLLGVVVSYGEDITIAIKGDLFDPITKGVIQLMEQRGYKYEMLENVEGKKYSVDIGEKLIKVDDKVVFLKYRYEEILKSVLDEKKENWGKVCFVVKDGIEANLFDTLEKSGVRKIVSYRSPKDLRNILAEMSKDKKIEKIYYIAIGEDKNVLNEVILPVKFIKDYSKLNIMILTKKICDELANIDIVQGLKNTEIYSFLSCVNPQEKILNLSEKLDGNVSSAIISYEIMNVVDREIFKKDVDDWFIFNSYQINGSYNLELKGYMVLSNEYRAVDLVKQIDLK
ncbi:hypothetical protein [Calditerrivibrio nitroreducens]|uniref:Uncharacterized protein n=2 Tax=Calditerrivibrio TaxID=545865 RepID=A0A2J6WPV8_9BACT|nr:MAG: hypothetical protein C0187_01570 [Calditerrivibrio nitroreducens]